MEKWQPAQSWTPIFEQSERAQLLPIGKYSLVFRRLFCALSVSEQSGNADIVSGVVLFIFSEDLSGLKLNIPPLHDTLSFGPTNHSFRIFAASLCFNSSAILCSISPLRLVIFNLTRALNQATSLLLIHRKSNIFNQLILMPSVD